MSIRDFGMEFGRGLRTIRPHESAPLGAPHPVGFSAKSFLLPRKKLENVLGLWLYGCSFCMGCMGSMFWSFPVEISISVQSSTGPRRAPASTRPRLFRGAVLGLRVELVFWSQLGVGQN